MKTLITTFFLCLTCIVIGQTPIEQVDSLVSQKTLPDSIFVPNYPEGVYLTKQEFLAKKPSITKKIIPVFIGGKLKKIDDLYVDNSYFYYYYETEKITKAFAVSYNGVLYFQIKAILKNRNKTDRSQVNSYPNSFVRVLLGGENYFYCEPILANGLAKGALVGAFKGAGSIAAQTLDVTKGVVFDFKNEEFNIFKNCKDFNRFIEDKNAEGIQDCKKHQPSLLEVRKIIEQIK